MDIVTEKNNRIAKNTIALYFRMGFTMIVGFFTTRVTLEVLGVEDYGLNNLLSSVVVMFGFINGSMGTAVQRFISIEIGKRNITQLERVFGTGLYLHLIVAFITFVLLQIFSFFLIREFNIPPERLFAAKVVFQISIISFVLGIVNVPYSALLRAREEFGKIALLDVFQAILRLLVLYLLYVITFDKIILLSILNFVISIIYIILTVIIASKYKETKFQIIKDKVLIKEMMAFVSMLIVTVFSMVLSKQGIILLINLFFSLAINAAYAIAFQMSNIIESFAMNFKQSIVPQIMQSYGEQDFERMNKLMFMGTKVTFVLMLIISVPIFFETDYILGIWLKEPPMYASMFTKLIIIDINISTFSYFIYQGVHASANIKKQQIYTSISYLLTVILIYIAFKLGANFYVAVYVQIFFSVVRNFIVLYIAKETINLNLKHFFNDIIKPNILLIFVVLLSNLVFLHLLESSFLRVIIISIGSLFLIMSLSYVLFLDEKEQSIVKKFISNLLLSINKKQ